MIIGQGLRTLLNEAGLNEFLYRLEDMKFEDTKMEFIDLAVDKSAKVSFITDKKLERYLDDMSKNYSSTNNYYSNISVEDFVETYQDDECVPDSFQEESFRNRYGTKTKIGRFMRKFFTEEEFPTSTIEKLTALCVEGLYELRMVDGEDIRKFYNEDYYASYNGSLGGSCMRYYECQDFFDIYVNHAKMLVLTSKSYKDSIFGRAILWDNVEVESREHNIKVMDRIYTSSTEFEEIFKKWANENGYFYKQQQNYSSINVVNNEEVIDLLNKAKISIGIEYHEYPYMDTFGTLMDNGDLAVTESNENAISLKSTAGNIRVTCWCCGKKTHFDSVRYGADDEYDKYHNYDEYSEDAPYYCNSCWDKKYIHIGGVGTVRREGCTLEYDYCALRKQVWLISDMLPYKGLNDDGEIFYGRISKYEENSVKYDEVEGIYYDVRLEKCRFCGKTHNTTQEEFKMVYEYDKKYSNENNRHAFTTVLACEECFNEQLEKNELEKFSHYYQLIGSNGQSGGSFYIVSSVKSVRCKKCGGYHDIESCRCRDNNYRIKDAYLLCDDCLKKEVDIINEQDRRAEELSEQIYTFRNENSQNLNSDSPILNMWSRNLAIIMVRHGLSIQDIAYMNIDDFQTRYNSNEYGFPFASL